jgi:O-acetyl-ADP-ribose deacetylase (regulator of RNase III)
MIERNGDLFTTTAKVIGHGVNCKGLMGAGIAKTFREKFPANYRYYNMVCHAATGNLQPGGYVLYHEDGKMIFNFASQNDPGADASYHWLFSSLFLGAARLNDRKSDLADYGNVIAIPEIGCGIGGLEWYPTRRVIRAVEACVPGIEFEVWHYA